MYGNESETLLIAILVTLVFLGGLWSGVNELSRKRPTPSWKVMVAGLIFLTMGSLLFYTLTASHSSGSEMIAIGAALAIVGGLLLFLGGFIAYALRMGRVVRRIAELEQLAASMSAELHHRQAATSHQQVFSGFPQPRP